MNGGHVRLQNYLAMPHVFQIFEKHPSTHTVYLEYARFIKEVTNGKIIETEMRIVNGKGMIQDGPLDLKQYPVTFTKEEVFQYSTHLISVTRANANRGITTSHKTKNSE
jgi:hypothetical protein